MHRLITRGADWAHEGLVSGAERLTAGHRILVDRALERLVRRPAKPAADADEKTSATEDPKTNAANKTARKGKAKAAPEKPAKDTENTEGAEAPKDGKNAGKDVKKDKEKAPPAHTLMRPGPRRMIAAAAHWTVDGEGAWDFVIRAGLLAGGLGIVGYFARPFLFSLTSIHPVWICVLFVILLAVELAPTLAALLLLGLASAMTTPALMWPAVILWALCAWFTKAPEEEPQAAPKPPLEEAEVDPPDTPRQAFARWVCLTIGNRGGIHLQELYPAMRKLPGHEHRQDPALRALIKGFGIPIQHSIRVEGIPGRSGVYLADVQPLLSPGGECSGENREDAGQSADSSPLSAVESGEESGGEPLSEPLSGPLPPHRLAENHHPDAVTAGTHVESTL